MKSEENDHLSSGVRIIYWILDSYFYHHMAS